MDIKEEFWKTVNQLTDDEFWWALPYEIDRATIEELIFKRFDEEYMEIFIENCKLNNIPRGLLNTSSIFQ